VIPGVDGAICPYVADRCNRWEYSSLRAVPGGSFESHQVEVDGSCYASHRHMADRSQRQRGCKAA